MFQSTHPHGVRLAAVYKAATAWDVSIHAPAWGATRRRLSVLLQRGSFNPRTRMGCDNMTWARYPTEMFQSTHPHGVRPGETVLNQAQTGFQSTHPHGVRRHAPYGLRFHGLFQSTHPHGVRPRFATIKIRLNEGFNPRTRMGCDQGRRKLHRGQIRFQSTHPHGVRQIFLSRASWRPCFNPRTRMGCDVHLGHAQVHCRVSIHAPAWGATLTSTSNV